MANTHAFTTSETSSRNPTAITIANENARFFSMSNKFTQLLVLDFTGTCQMVLRASRSSVAAALAPKNSATRPIMVGIQPAGCVRVLFSRFCITSAPWRPTRVLNLPHQSSPSGLFAKRQTRDRHYDDDHRCHREQRIECQRSTQPWGAVGDPPVPRFRQQAHEFTPGEWDGLWDLIRIVVIQIGHPLESTLGGLEIDRWNVRSALCGCTCTT